MGMIRELSEILHARENKRQSNWKNVAMLVNIVVCFILTDIVMHELHILITICLFYLFIL